MIETTSPAAIKNFESKLDTLIFGDWYRLRLSVEEQETVYAGWKLQLALLQTMEEPPAIEIVRWPDNDTGFVTIARRWVVERTFAWLGRCRSLAKDWEKAVSSANAWLTIAAIRRQARFVARTIKSNT